MEHAADCQLYTVTAHGLCTCDFDARMRADALPKLWQAIVDNTKGDLFWLGEHLLDVIKTETGYRHPVKHRPVDFSATPNT